MSHARLLPPLALFLLAAGLVPQARGQELDFDLDAAPPPKPEVQPVPDNDAAFGVMVRSGTTRGYGRYLGGAGTGAAPVVDWTAGGRSPDGTYYDTTARDLELPPDGRMPQGRVGLRTGRQGVWGFQAEIQGSQFLQSDGFKSVVSTDGSLVPGVTANSGAASAARQAALAPRMEELTASVDRDRVRMGLNGRMDQWRFSSRMTHEERHGTLEQSLSLGAVLAFPTPVDYATDRFDASAAYTVDRLQGMVEYSFSRFTNSNPFFVVRTPYSANAAAFALPPDNDAHQVATRLSWQPTDRISATTNLSYGVQLQNQGFTPVSASLASAAPQGGLGAAAQTWQVQTALAVRPLDRLDLKGSVNVDGRDAGVDTYANILASNNDSSTKRYTAVPQSWLKQNARLDATWRMTPAQRLRLGVSHSDVQRTNAQATRNRENTANVGISSRLGMGAEGALDYERSERSAELNPSAPWSQLGYSGINGVASYQASRHRDAIKTRVSASPDPDWSLGMNGRLSHDVYAGQAQGVTRAYSLSAGPDVAVTPRSDLTLHAYYSYERMFSALHQKANATVEWSEGQTDQVHTLGLGAEWKPATEYKFSADVNASYGNTSFALYDGLGGAASGTAGIDPLGDVTTHMLSLRLNGERQLTPEWSVGVGYAFERMFLDDWAYGWASGQPTDSTGSLMGGTSAPDYAVHTVLVKLRGRW